MAKIKTDRGNVDVCEEDCAYRSCLWVGEHKGTFVKGRGYTSYFKTPELVCWTRHQNGCPHPLPELDPEAMRCCPAPEFAKSRPSTRKQRCRLCGTTSPMRIVELIKTLPRLPYVKCKHESPVRRGPLSETRKMWHCTKCNHWFPGQKPQPFEYGEDFSTVLDLVLGEVKVWR